MQGNPFLYSDTNKRYHTYDYYLKRTFGEKVAKITLDGGFTCPNRDGTCGMSGCIYCSNQGAGEFVARGLSLEEQYRVQKERMTGKWKTEKFIAYFQSFTNTYAPLSRLVDLYEQALALPGVVGLNIATRADCLPDDVIDYLATLSERTVLTVELGLQTIHDETARKIGRGHDFATFLDAYRRLRERAPRVRIGVHVIFGLIGENDEMMLQTVQSVGALCPDEVKIHLLYVSKGTKMAEIYENGQYFPLERERYADLVVKAISYLPATVVVSRVTGDGDKKTLLAPLWSADKRKILNIIDKKFYELDIWQGKRITESSIYNY